MSDPSRTDKNYAITISGADAGFKQKQTWVGGHEYLYPGVYSAVPSGKQIVTDFGVRDKARVVYVEDEEKGSLVGSVRDADNKDQPIVGASVSILLKGKTKNLTTDANGDFKLEDADAALCKVTTSAAGYSQDNRLIQILPGKTTSTGIIYLEKPKIIEADVFITDVIPKNFGGFDDPFAGFPESPYSYFWDKPSPTLAELMEENPPRRMVFNPHTLQLMEPVTITGENGNKITLGTDCDFIAIFPASIPADKQDDYVGCLVHVTGYINKYLHETPEQLHLLYPDAYAIWVNPAEYSFVMLSISKVTGLK